MTSLVVPPSALFTPHTWTRDTANTSTQDPRLVLVNSSQDPTILEFQYQTRGSHCNVCVTHEHMKCVSQLIHLPHQTDSAPYSPEHLPLSVFSIEENPVITHATSAIHSMIWEEGSNLNASPVNQNRVVRPHDLDENEMRLTIILPQPILSRMA